MLEFCILQGGRIVEAFPRGFAKTAILMRACLWAAIYDHRSMIMLYSKNVESADELLEGIQTELTGNGILHELYPRICVPFRALHGSSHRAKHQSYNGQLTKVNLKEGVIRFATIPKEKSSGNMIISLPMSSARGKQKTIAVDDETYVLRPDFVAIDDPSDEDISGSKRLTEKLVAMIKKGVLRGGGHTKTLPVAMAVTVIEPKDCADTFLNDASWQSLRIPMMHKMPVDKELWDEYRDIRLGFDPTVPGALILARIESAKFYLENQEKMDEGAEPVWEWAYEYEDEPQTEFSAIQHAMNILIDEGPSVFNCECQNNPEDDEQSRTVLDRESLMVKQHHTTRHILPRDTEKVVAFVDLGLHVFWYGVAGFAMNFEGYLVDRETYPKQDRRLFAKSAIPTRFADQAAYASFLNEDGSVRDENGIIYNALHALLPKMLEAKYVRDKDGARMQIDRIGVDSRKWTSVVYQVISEIDNDRIVPTMGWGSSKTNPPIANRKAKQNERKGPGYLYKESQDNNPRVLEIDTNERKTFAIKRLVAPLKSTSFSFFEHDAEAHELMVDHCFAEYSRLVETKWGDITTWHHKHNKPDNDYWDVITGLMALASFEGCETIGNQAPRDPKKPPSIDLKSWLGDDE